MKKILTPLLFAVIASAAPYAQPTFDRNAICNSIASSYGNAYQMSDKKQSPEEFCTNIVRDSTKQQNFICNVDEVISKCISNIKSQLN